MELAAALKACDCGGGLSDRVVVARVAAAVGLAREQRGRRRRGRGYGKGGGGDERGRRWQRVRWWRQGHTDKHTP